MRAEEAIRHEPTVVGRYAIYDRIGAGGMATVHVGRLLGNAGFARTVAIKRLHAQYALDPDFVGMFVDEGRVASRIRHPNVVATFDVVAEQNELFIVMEYVEGEALTPLVRAANKRQELTSPALAVAIICDVLHGLHAAHTATNERGEPLGIVHRDVSPHNVLVGTDGVARVLDFGIAKALGRAQTTQEGRLKGKLGYMSPEHVSSGHVSPRSDVFGASIVLWELLTGRHLFEGEGEAALLNAVQTQKLEPARTYAPDVPAALDEVVMKGLERDPAKRWSSAAEMAEAVERALKPAPRRAVGEWVVDLAGATLAQRRALVAEIESASVGAIPIGARKLDAAPVSGPVSGPVSIEHGGFVEPTTMIRARNRRAGIALGAAAAGAAALVIVAVIVIWLATRTTPSEITPATAASTPSAEPAAPPPPPAPSAAADTTAPSAAASSDTTIDFGDTPAAKAPRKSPGSTSRPHAPTKPKEPPKAGAIFSRE